MKLYLVLRICRRTFRSCLRLLPCVLLLRTAVAVSWLPFGPDGGDARSFAVDPRDAAHLFLGTANGWMYESRNGGGEWRRLAQVGQRDDLVLDHIVVDPADPKHVLVATWALGKPDGGLFASHDAGVHWAVAEDLKGQSVLSLAGAPSDPKIFVAGTLDGVYRSADSGEHWALISPAGSKELHEVESVAIDPVDPQVIYAGTWHLPWKTADGGQNWSNMKDGIIDDSDVFSIIVDPKQPQTVYASACSGIYKSENAGALFRKIQGIPSTARRTRVLKQSVQDPNTVFAGTTEGLFRTEDAGANWSRMTDPNVIVNDVLIDPADAKHVLLATDRAGILASRDGGVSFEASNKGFSARQVSSYAAIASRPGTVFVGVVNDKEFGGVFESETGGLSWFQRSGGLEGRDVFSLAEAPDAVLLAGTSHGIFRLENDVWVRSEVLGIAEAAASRDEKGAPKQTLRAAPVKPSAGVAQPGKTIKGKRPAPTKKGAQHGTAKHVLFLLQSPNKSSSPAKGKPKNRKASVAKGTAAKTKNGSAAKVRPTQGALGARPGKGVTALKPTVVQPASPKVLDGGAFGFARQGDTMYAATLDGLLSSTDAGKSWRPAPGVPAKEWRYVSVAKGVLAVADLKSLLRSTDNGQTWTALDLPAGLTQISAMGADDSGTIWVGGLEGLYVAPGGSAEWQPWKGFYLRDINSIFFDAEAQRMLITANPPSRLVLAIHVPDHATKYWDVGWNLRFARPVGDYLIGATLFDGVVVQPRMVDSPSATGAHAGGED